MRVLVVDPDERARHDLTGLVEELGHEALSAGDAGTAWAVVLGMGCDVVVTELRLPGVDGLELTRRIRALDEDSYTYVVVRTAAGEHDEGLRAVRAGADDHLAKPLDARDLEARLVAAARVTELHRQLAERRRELARVNDELQEAVRTDPLTGLYNRRRLEEDAPVLDEGLRRYDRPFAVAMADVDRFKAYNDRNGHVAGDDVLRAIGSRLRSSLRQGDVLYRYGGEELLLVFPVRGLGRARVAAERARQAVESLAIPHPDNDAGVVTVSIGVAEASADGGLAAAIADADAALYEAKAAGANRVVVAHPPVPARIHLG